MLIFLLSNKIFYSLFYHLFRHLDVCFIGFRYWFSYLTWNTVYHHLSTPFFVLLLLLHFSLSLSSLDSVEEVISLMYIRSVSEFGNLVSVYENYYYYHWYYYTYILQTMEETEKRKVSRYRRLDTIRLTNQKEERNTGETSRGDRVPG